MPIQETARHNGQRGSAIIGSLFVVMMVSALSIAYLQLVLGSTNEQRSSIDAKRAFYMAEAGLAEAYVALRSGGTGAVGTAEVPASFANGMFWVEIEDLGDDRVLLRSTGLCMSGRRALELVVEPEQDTRVALGVFGIESVTIGADTVVSTRLSGDGFTESVSIGSNASIILEEDSLIDGDAVPGVDQAVELNPGAEVLGSTAPREEVIMVDYPVLPFDTGTRDLVVSPETPVTIPSGEHSVGSLQVLGRGTLNLTGPMHIVLKDLELGDGARLLIDDGGGAVDVWVTGNVSFGAGSSTSTTSGNAQDLYIHIVPTTGMLGVDPTLLTVAPHAAFTGNIDAPDSTVQVASDVTFFGTLTGKTITIGSDVTLEIDPASVWPAGFADGVGAVSWKIEDLPDERMVRIRLDPYRLMKLLGLKPPPSDAAHDMALDAYLDDKYQTSDFDAVLFEDEALAREQLGVTTATSDGGSVLGP